MNAGAKRKRGVTLTAIGIQRLRQVIEQVEAAENHGSRYTIEELSSRAGISTSTMSRLWSSQSGVDQRSLRLLFSAFNLELTNTDFQKTGPADAGPVPDAYTPDTGIRPMMVYPSGPVPLRSSFYIPRPPAETRASEEITRPGCVVRIKAPSGFGKSSLLLRVVHYAETLGYAIASIDLQQADPAILGDADRFLQWFCIACALKLGLEPKLADCWNDTVGNLLSTTLYLREYLMAQVSGPLVLNIQEFNHLFAHPKTAQAFLPLLRSWHEEARYDTRWQNLRLVVSYSTDNYLPLDINQSPFNVGLPLMLPEFTASQVGMLAEQYGLSWTTRDCDRLMDLVGGNPTLVSVALYHLRQGDLSLVELLQTAPTHQGIYHNHLQRIAVCLQANSQLLASLEPLISRHDPMALEPILAYQLEGMGLIKAVPPDGWLMSCNLYRTYCRNYVFQTT